MAPARKHGAHRVQLNIGNMAAGSANDLLADIFDWDSYAAEGAGTINLPTNNYDTTAYSVQEASVTTYTTLTGQATNFASLRLTHTDSAGNVKNRIRVAFSGTGIVATALTSMNFAVASGATVPGAGTGVLTVDTGTALPWTLVPGDDIVFDRVSNNATGLATPSASATILIGQAGS